MLFYATFCGMREKFKSGNIAARFAGYDGIFNETIRKFSIKAYRVFQKNLRNVGS